MLKYCATSYLRLSHASAPKETTLKNERKIESDSIANQRTFIKDFIEKQADIELVSEKVDDGFTGMVFERPAFLEMMEDVKSGKTNCIIVKDLSRFGREYIEFGRYLREVLPLYDVRFIAINDTIDTAFECEGDNLTLNIKTMMNDNYCKDISQKIKSALDIKRKKGDFVGSFAVYGYLKSSENRNMLFVDNYASNIIRSIFAMKIKGHSANKIAEHLNEEKVLSPLAYRKSLGLPHAKNGITDSENPLWSATAVVRILKNQTYMGDLIQGKREKKSYKLKEFEVKNKEDWIVVKNTHEAIVSRHTFYLARDIMLLDTRTAPNQTITYPFSGLLICGCCGARMTRKIIPTKKKSYYYYYCPTGKKGGCNANNMINENMLLEAASHAVQSHIHTVIGIHSLVSTLNKEKIQQTLIKKQQSQIQKTITQLEEMKMCKSSLYKRYLAHFITKDEMSNFDPQYTRQIKQLEETLMNQQDGLAYSQDFHGKRYEWMEHFRNYGELESLTREIVVQLIHSVTIHSKDNITIAFRYQNEYEQFIEILSKERVGV